VSGQIQYGVSCALTSGTTPQRDELEERLALLEAVDLMDRLAREGPPVVVPAIELPPGEPCHFVAAVRVGRRRGDQFGHLELTGRWLKFHGALDLSIVWDEIADVRRTGRDIQVSLTDSRRAFRFSCHTLGEAVRGSVIARYLLGRALATETGAEAPHHATV
jgi:hypothetical protein